MGQKVNPNIFRLGINKTWKTQFFEKTNQELKDFTFVDLEISKHMKQFLQNQNLFLHDYKLQYSNSAVNIKISYFSLFSFLSSEIKEPINENLINSSHPTRTFNFRYFKSGRQKQINLNNSTKNSKQIVLFKKKHYFNNLEVFKRYKNIFVKRHDTTINKTAGKKLHLHLDDPTKTLMPKLTLQLHMRIFLESI